MKTLEDVKRVVEITDRLLELGIPRSICNRIHTWNKKREEELQNLTRGGK